MIFTTIITKISKTDTSITFSTILIIAFFVFQDMNKKDEFIQKLTIRNVDIKKVIGNPKIKIIFNC